jgi:glutamate racemase
MPIVDNMVEIPRRFKENRMVRIMLLACNVQTVLARLSLATVRVGAPK